MLFLIYRRGKGYRGVISAPSVLTYLGKIARFLRSGSSFDVEQAFHSQAVASLEAEGATIQKRIDQMYLDKLDGVIDTAFFERHATDRRTSQRALRHPIEDHEHANQRCLDEGIMLLELAHEAPRLFAGQPPEEQRKLLGFLLLNSTCAAGKKCITLQ